MVDNFKVQLEAAMYGWVEVKEFRFGASYRSEVDVISALIESAEYCDLFQGYGSRLTDPRVHGPYWASAIKPEDYVASSEPSAIRTILQWARSWGSLTEGTLQELERRVLSIFIDGQVFELKALPEQALHDVSSINADEFHEFVVVDTAYRRLVEVATTAD